MKKKKKKNGILNISELVSKIFDQCAVLLRTDDAGSAAAEPYGGNLASLGARST